MNDAIVSLPHAAELGAFVGNVPPHWSSLPHLDRGTGVIFEYGDIETSSRLESSGAGYVLVDRDRAHEEKAAEFTHLEDAERFVAIRGGRNRSAGRWFQDRATAPDDVDVRAEGGAYSFSWVDGAEEHEVRAFGVPEASTAYRLCWVRTLPFEQVIDVVTAQTPMDRLREHGLLR
ncbi:hypothetical protein FHW23_003017 [Curtobacterium pusillum]|uniref:Uncharacterized protein n=1 Tax=Curtobacterium pusillum TaxID=69373 RepID=A0AAW3T9H2_9MICO|nr:hypothetical protein [Curtobacterium pusillum]MBA8991739.1 hypothetical protein [Curtobacterium pusillum]